MASQEISLASEETIKRKGTLKPQIKDVSPASNQDRNSGDFPEGPVVKTSPSNAQGVVFTPAQRAKIPYASWPNMSKHMTEQYGNKFNNDFLKR